MIFLLIFLSIVNTIGWVILNLNNKNTWNKVKRYSVKKRKILLIPPCSIVYILYMILYKEVFEEIKEVVKKAWED